MIKFVKENLAPILITLPFMAVPIAGAYMFYEMHNQDADIRVNASYLTEQQAQNLSCGEMKELFQFRYGPLYITNSSLEKMSPSLREKFILSNIKRTN